MIRILMLDLGDTLVHGDAPLPHVPEALGALTGFDTTDGGPLELSLVSDYTMPEPPVTPQKVEAIFHEYLGLLERFGLAEYFGPPEQHVTLSTHAGALKPDRRVFETAIRRLGLDATLAECLFITEDADHIAAARALGLETLRFGADFADWSVGPLLVAHLVAPDSDADLLAALQVRLAVTHHVQVVSAERAAGGTVRAKVQAWHPLTGPSLGALDGVHVEMPVDATIRLDERGRVRSVTVGAPTAEAVREATGHVRALAAGGKVAGGPGPLPPVATHAVEVDAEGRRLLKRKRFSAV